jgi:ribosomal protein S18 acetylase RimI-like enzyme
MVEIISADTDEWIQHVITLSHEYVTWMVAAIQEHYPQLDITEFTSEHEYDDVRKKFPGEHVPPYGRLYVAVDGERVGGCVALGRLSETVCEMRTLYVRPAFRGMGMGQKLVDKVLHEAREIGYSHMRLDTLGFMDNALRLYRARGFHDIQPYRDISVSLKQYIRFLEADLRV